MWHPAGIAIVELWHDLAFKRRIKSLGIPVVLLGFVATMTGCDGPADICTICLIPPPQWQRCGYLRYLWKTLEHCAHEPLIRNQGYMRAKAGARVTSAICPQIWFLPRVTVVVAREPNGLRARYENFIEAAEQWPTVATTYGRAHIR